MRSLVRRNDTARLDTHVETIKRDTGLVIDCFAELHFNMDTFEGDSTIGVFVEKKSGSNVGAGHTDYILVFTV